MPGPRCTHELAGADAPLINVSNFVAVLPSYGSICVPLPAILSVRFATQMSIRGGSKSSASSRDMRILRSFVCLRNSDRLTHYSGPETSRKYLDAPADSIGMA